MASFTDAISQFNPYVQQLPVDLMAKVGMQKQAQYDAGVQKIQQQIDNVAGMDVGNPINKQYLDSKLNELGGNLKVFAAGDFSNQQLVNTVGGLTKNLVNDPIIQQSVLAAQTYKKGMTQLNDDIAKGKAKDHTTWLFTQNAEKWLNATTPGESFNYRYQTPTADPTKKALEAIKALHPNLQQMQDPFEVINGIRTGKLASVLKEYKVEGITEPQIAQAVSAVLDANDLRDLDIQGMYNFRNVDKLQLAESATKNYQNDVKSAEAELKILKEQKQIANNNPNLAAQLDKRIKYYTKQLGEDGELATTYRDRLSNIETNPDAVKGSIYKQGFISSFANAFKWSSTTEEVKDSPYEKVRQFETRLAFDKNEAAIKHNEWFQTHALNVKEYELKEKAYKADHPEQTWVPIGLDASSKRDAVQVYEGIIQSEVDNGKAALDDLKYAGYSEGQITSMVKEYSEKGNKAKIEPDAIGSVREYLRARQQSTVLKDNLDRYKTAAQAKALADNPEWAGDKSIPTYNPYTRKLEYDKVDILHQLETGKANLVVDRAPAGMIRLSFTRNDGSKGYYEIKKSQGGAQFAEADKLRPILLGMVEKKKVYGENLADMLAPFASELTGRVKAIGDKDSNIPANIATGLAAYIYATKQQGIAADAKYNPDVAAQLLDAKNLKDTRALLYNRGNDYELVLSSLSGAAQDQRIRLSGAQANSLLGDSYVEKNSRDVTMMNLSRDRRSTLNDPKNALMQTQFGDFPNIQKLQVTANLKEDTQHKGLYVPIINVLKKDGEYQSFSIAGRNNMQRLGYDQGKEKVQGLSDSELLSLIRENYPNYDINLLDID